MIPVLRANAAGSTYEAVTADDLGALRFPGHAIGSQRAIADYLDTETARIDALIERKARLVRLVRERARAFAASRLTRGRVAAANAVQGSAHQSAGVPQLRRFLAGMQYGTGQAAARDGQIAVFGMGNMDDDGAVGGDPAGYLADVDSGLLLSTGDLLFNRTNSREKVGKVGIVGPLAQPTTFASYLVRLKTTEMVTPHFLNYLLNCDEVLGVARSMALPSIGQANLNPSRYSELRVPVPSTTLQKDNVRELDERWEHARTLRRALHCQILLLQEHRQALITAAVTGELPIPGAA